jgi:hypothetical protein
MSPLQLLRRLPSLRGELHELLSRGKDFTLREYTEPLCSSRQRPTEHCVPGEGDVVGGVN